MLRRQAAFALLWSLSQSWVVKFSSLFLFFVLARYLTPEQMGLAATVLLVVTLVNVLSEQGYVETIVQRRTLLDHELNLPFLVSCGTAVLLSAALFGFAEQVAELAGLHGRADLVRWSAVIPPLVTVMNFEVAARRRALDFKSIAQANFIAAIIAVSLAIYTAVIGVGEYALIIHAAVTVLATVVMLQIGRRWSFRLHLDRRSFASIFSNSSKIHASRIVDFFSGRIVDLIVLSRFGAIGLGFYTVGSKIYLTLLQLLAYSLMDVALSAFSKVSVDVAKIKKGYLTLISLSSVSTFPLFMGIAAVAPEISFVLFGDKWIGIDKVVTALSFLGAVQVISVFNGAVLLSLGRSGIVLLFNFIRITSALVAMQFVKAENIAELTWIFVISQLLMYVFPFYVVSKLIKIDFWDLLRSAFAGVFVSLFAFACVLIVREIGIIDGESKYISMFIFGIVFFIVYSSCLLPFSARKVISDMRYVMGLKGTK